MPPSGKRSSRTRRDTRKEPSTDSIDQSSPSRPSKRRKAELPVPETVDEDTSSITAEQSGININDDDQLITQVTQHLLAPHDSPIQASKDHANAIHEANKDGVQAYAKIAALDWTFYITKLTINIGRTPEGIRQSADACDDEDYVHIDLGPAKTISREHAQIYFDSTKEQWYLLVKGRNGLNVDGQKVAKGEAQALASGQVIEIGGIEMMFVLPSDIGPLVIGSVYLQRAGIVKPVSSSPAQGPRASARSYATMEPPSSLQTRSGAPTFQQPIAPAPPDYKRPGTPPSAKRGLSSSQLRSPSVGAGGTMLMNASDVDFSHDDNKHIKPQYSYAQLITQAILSTPEQKLNLAGIYSYISNNYSYYRHQQAAGWQNSIRHNLSLSKSFEKVPRSTDEPGKGMKWQLVADHREDMIQNAWKGGRGGHRGSSNPSSPNQLNYITHGPRDMAAKEPGSSRKRKVSPTGSPQPRSALRNMHMTPDRSQRHPLPTDATVAVDGSPLPRMRKVAPSSSGDGQPGSPTLPSSYLGDEPTSFVTPAPLRVHPKLAPPSTAQRPSQHMPTSSPAPFWKFADINSTPLKPAQFDRSPTRPLGNSFPQSSSPPAGPNRSPVASPTRGSRITTSVETHVEAADEPEATVSGNADVEEDAGFDLTKGFQSIGSYHAPARLGQPVAPALNGTNGVSDANGSGSMVGPDGLDDGA